MARSGRAGLHTGVWLETLKERDSFEDLGVNGRIILNGSEINRKVLRVLNMCCLGLVHVACSCVEG